MSSNIFFEENGKKLFGQRFGYAIEYRTMLKENLFLQFFPGMVMAEDARNVSKPEKLKLVSECISETAKKQGEKIIVVLYDTAMQFSPNDTIFEIESSIKQLQKTFIIIPNSIKVNIIQQLRSKIDDIISSIDVF